MSSWNPTASWVPNALTLGNAICGLVGIWLLINASDTVPVWVGGLIFIGWVFDMTDGMLARTLKVDGPFGAILDSLCDVVTFGTLPALVVLVCASELGGVMEVVGWIGAIAYLSAALLRLARFTQKSEEPKPARAGHYRVFEGLSSPGAAMAVASCLFVWPAAAPVMALVVAPLMVSRWAYPDLGQIYASGALPRWHLALPVCAALIVGPAQTLMGFFALYIVTAPMVDAHLIRRAQA